jgi:DNA-binding transcriptional LysR family regulator
MTNQNTPNIRLQELMVFHAILSNGSITAASEALGISQSSVSKQLKNLRSYFVDELFVRSGQGMAPTSKALVLAPRISALIGSFEELHGEIDFDPGYIERNFVISTSDEVQHYLLPSLVERISTESPKSKVTFKVLDRDYATKQLESGSVDLAITLNWHAPDHLKQTRLFRDDFVIIHRTGHPLQGDKMTMKQYLSANHMMVSPLGHAHGPVDEILASLGKKRTVSLIVPYFMQVADALLNSDLIVTLQRRACTELMKTFPLSISESPIKMRPVNYFMFWHKRYDKDSTNRWLRQVCCDVMRDGSG